MSEPTDAQEPEWVAWAPPLDPPTPGGLSVATAERIAQRWWEVSPHRCAALQWEAYAATLPASNPVTSVSTGAQSVTYNPPVATGDFGQAMAQATWHRGFLGQLGSVPLSTARRPAADPTLWIDP